MKPIRLYYSLCYLTEVGEGTSWRPDDYKAWQIIKTVKGEPFNGYFVSSASGARRTYDQKNAHQFLPHMFGVIARQLQDIAPDGCAFVPVPNSSAIVGRKDSFRSLEMAKMLSEQIPGTVAIPALRWIREKQQAHNGGHRDADRHYDNLKVVLKTSRPVVLFDDVKTSGSQIVASVRRLREAGMAPTCAVVVGAVTKEQHKTMLKWRAEWLEIA